MSYPAPHFIEPQFHQDIERMSFENFWKIRKTYKEILGLHGIDHFSMNIVDPNHKTATFSYTPAILSNLIHTGLYRYNGAMSPTYYEHLDFFTWEQCYDRRFSELMKIQMEKKFGINLGLAFVRKIGGFHLIYIFATKGSKTALLEETLDKTPFLSMGDHCYDLLRETYSQYSEHHEPPHLHLNQEDIHAKT